MVQGGFLSGEQRAHLEALVRRPSERHGIARRANAMLLLDDGLSCEAVARVLYLDDDTVRGWHERFRREGVRALSVFGWKGGASRLTPAQEAELTETLTRRLFPSTAAVMAHIERTYGVAYSKAGTIKLLHRLELRVAQAQGAARPRRRRRAGGLRRRLRDAAQRSRARRDRLFRRCGASRVPEPARPWLGPASGEHLAVRRGKGRQRVNLAGALCLETGHCQIVEDLRITAETTVELFARLERANPDKRLIHVILDNAGTNRGQPLRAWLARPDCRIRPIYLPAYAPNLNAIERLWKVMHQHVTHNRYYDDFRTFAEAIMRFFTTTLPQGWRTIRDTVNDGSVTKNSPFASIRRQSQSRRTATSGRSAGGIG